MSLVVQTLWDTDAFDRARPDWDDLLERAGRTEVYLSHRWLAAWFRHFLEEDLLRVLVVKDGERWVGAMPLIQETRTWRGVPMRILRFPVNQASANLRSGLILAKGAERAAGALVEFLKVHATEWERWDLDGLVAGAPGYAELQSALHSTGFRTTTWQLAQELYYVRLPGSWKDYLAGRSRKFRRTLHNAMNRAARAETLELRSCLSLPDVEAALKSVLALDAESTKSQRAGVVRLEGAAADFYRELVATFAAAGRCRIDMTVHDGIVTGSLFTLFSRGTAFLLHVAHSARSERASPGRLLFAHLLRQAQEAGLAEVDINGRTPFVQSWTDTSRAVLSCKVYNRAVRSRIAWWREQVIAPARIRAESGYRLLTATPVPGDARPDARLSSRALPRALQGGSVGFYADGRTALARGLESLPLERGAEVLFPSYHCGSEFDVLLAQGFVLRYYEVPLQLEVDLNVIQSAITPATRAVYLIHYLGWPQDVAPVAEFCRSRGLVLIEDCAQALYSGSKARPVGVLGDLSIFSLHKFLPSIDGGAAVLRDGRHPPDADGLDVRDQWLLRLRSKSLALRARAGSLAAIGHVGLESLDALWHSTRLAPRTKERTISEAALRLFRETNHAALIETRNANYGRLHALFLGRVGIEPFFAEPGDGFVPLMFPAWVDNPDPLLAALANAGIEAGLHWSGLDARFPVERFAEVIRLKAHLVILPVHQQMSDDDHARLAGAIESLGYPARPRHAGGSTMESDEDGS